MSWWWFSCPAMTVGIRLDEQDHIRETPPILRRFIGQPVLHLLRWQPWDTAPLHPGKD